MPRFIHLPHCQKHGVYSLHSRNLSLGVFDGVDGFIGIRLKFGNRFLDKEFHWDKGPPFGTARPVRLLHYLSPSYSCVAQLPGAIDETTGRRIYFDVDSSPNLWKFESSGEVVPSPRPRSISNTELFYALVALEPLEKNIRADHS